MSHWSSALLRLCLYVAFILVSHASLNHLLGIQLKDSVVLSASSKQGMGLVSLQDDVKNIQQIGDCLVGYSGYTVLCDLLHRDLMIANKQQEMSLGRSMNVQELIANCRLIIRKRYRSIIMQQEQEVLGLLIAGWEHCRDVGDTLADTIALKPVLYWINEFGEVKKVPYGAHGALATSLLSYCDRTQIELSQKSSSDNQDSYTGWSSLTRDEATPKIEDIWETVQMRSNIVMTRVYTKWLAKPKSKLSCAEISYRNN